MFWGELTARWGQHFIFTYPCKQTADKCKQTADKCKQTADKCKQLQAVICNQLESESLKSFLSYKAQSW